MSALGELYQRLSHASLPSSLPPPDYLVKHIQPTALIQSAAPTNQASPIKPATFQPVSPNQAKDRCRSASTPSIAFDGRSGICEGCGWRMAWKDGTRVYLIPTRDGKLLHFRCAVAKFHCSPDEIACFLCESKYGKSLYTIFDDLEGLAQHIKTNHVFAEICDGSCGEPQCGKIMEP